MHNYEACVRDRGNGSRGFPGYVALAAPVMLLATNEVNSLFPRDIRADSTVLRQD